MHARSKLFQTIPLGEFNKAQTHFIRRSFNTLSSVFQEGDPSRSVFLLQSGLIKMSKSAGARGGRTVALEIIAPGRLFGALAVMDGRPYPASAIALHPCVVDEIPGPLFSRLVEKFPAFARDVYQDIGQHLRHAQFMRALAHEPAAQRVMAALLLLTPSGDETHLRREDVAELAGCIPETAIRVLSRLKNLGLIQTGWKKISLKDKAGLRLLLDNVGGKKEILPQEGWKRSPTIPSNRKVLLSPSDRR